jgi:uncharacterized protein (TIGR03067 family)
MNATRIIRSCFFVAALILFSAPSWCAEPDNPLLGRWLVQRVGIRDATKLPVQFEWEFTKDKVIVRDITNSQEVSRNNYTVDLTKDPKWITVTVVDQVTELRPGIFRIVGEELHLKQAVGGGVRPSDFPRDGYSIMKRQKKRNGQQAGAANESQPIRSETNRTSSAAGSRR